MCGATGVRFVVVSRDEVRKEEGVPVDAAQQVVVRLKFVAVTVTTDALLLGDGVGEVMHCTTREGTLQQGTRVRVRNAGMQQYFCGPLSQLEVLVDDKMPLHASISLLSDEAFVRKRKRRRKILKNLIFFLDFLEIHSYSASRDEL